MNCIDCTTETFHDNGLCSECYDRRFNDPARVLPTQLIQVAGPAPNAPWPLSAQRSALHVARIVAFWEAITEGPGDRVRRAAWGLRDRGVTLAPILEEHLTRIEEPFQREMRQHALAIFQGMACSACGGLAMKNAKRCQACYHGGLECLVAGCPHSVTGQESGILSCFCEAHDDAWVSFGFHDKEAYQHLDPSQRLVLWLAELGPIGAAAA